MDRALAVFKLFKDCLVLSNYIFIGTGSVVDEDERRNVVASVDPTRFSHGIARSKILNANIQLTARSP